MKPCELQIMLSREWRELGQHTGPWRLTPEARVVTGNPKYDARLHRIVIEYGVELDVDPRYQEVKNYRVIDEKKFMWFLLRWS